MLPLSLVSSLPWPSLDFRETIATEQPEDAKSRCKAPGGRREAEANEQHLKAGMDAGPGFQDPGLKEEEEGGGRLDLGLGTLYRL